MRGLRTVKAERLEAQSRELQQERTQQAKFAAVEAERDALRKQLDEAREAHDAELQGVVRKAQAQKKNADNMRKEHAALEEKIKKARKTLREAEDLHGFADSLKTFTPASLGEGKPNGGTLTHKKARLEVLNRLQRHGARFSHQQAAASFICLACFVTHFTVRRPQQQSAVPLAFGIV